MVVRRTVFFDFLLKLFIVLGSVGFPRLMLVGGLPGSDEGMYAYFAQQIHASVSAGQGLPDSGPLMLYPILSSWVFGLSTNHLITLRILDMLVAIVAGWLLFEVIKTESKSRIGGALISLIFLFVMNQPIFIQAGFKNSIFAAYIPLFLALQLAQREDEATDASWLIIGALTALSVLLRETFVPFLIVGAVAVMITKGWKTLLRFSIGAAACGVSIMAAVLIARGSVNGLIVGYRDAGAVYASVASLRVPLFITNSISSAHEAIIPLYMGACSLIILVVTCFFKKDVKTLGCLLFWIATILVALIEPVSKIGFPYHFAVALPGLAGLTALAWRSLSENMPTKLTLSFLTAATVGCAYLLSPKFLDLASSWYSSKPNLAVAGDNIWPLESVRQSNYLLAAEAIQKASSVGETLGVSGFMFTLYPLTGLLPPSNDVSNLNTTFLLLGSDPDGFGAFLKSCAPDIVMTATRTDFPGSAAVAKVVQESGLYREVAVIPVAPEKSYGTFGGTVYKKIDSQRGLCNTKIPR